MRPTRHIALIAALAAPVAVHATQYLTVEQAQATMFPGETLKPDFRALTPDQIAAIAKAAGEAPPGRDVRVWRASGGGWFVLDQVIGKHEWITYAVALDPSGAVKSIEILDYREAYGGQVRDPRWRAQFAGKRAGQPLQAGREIKTISGATLSSSHVTNGVRRVLATYALVLAHHG